MVAVLFKRKAAERISQDEKEMNLLKRRVNLTNWSKGLYPLKKEPTGLSMTDRMVDIDPGLCDIFVMVDGSSEDVNNKKTVKERSVRVCSGFDWSKQVELNNRAAAGMQAVCDEISSLDNGGSNTILNYLQVLSKNRKKIFCFMKEYRHRETKGYLYSNRQITDDYMPTCAGENLFWSPLRVGA
ncbi:hypothetical protein RMCBS344292_08455 [Rhizopus microsporus]|nr:hypothetical protein RMCBS344292_08455 [Rhizopus microsporus]